MDFTLYHSRTFPSGTGAKNLTDEPRCRSVGLETGSDPLFQVLMQDETSGSLQCALFSLLSLPSFVCSTSTLFPVQSCVFRSPHSLPFVRRQSPMAAKIRHALLTLGALLLTVPTETQAQFGGGGICSLANECQYLGTYSMSLRNSSPLNRNHWQATAVPGELSTRSPLLWRGWVQLSSHGRERKRQRKESRVKSQADVQYLPLP